MRAPDLKDILCCLVGSEVRREVCSSEAGILVVDEMVDLTLGDVKYKREGPFESEVMRNSGRVFGSEKSERQE